MEDFLLFGWVDIISHVFYFEFILLKIELLLRPGTDEPPATIAAGTADETGPVLSFFVRPA